MQYLCGCLMSEQGGIYDQYGHNIAENTAYILPV